jgi:hypothetical protein
MRFGFRVLTRHWFEHLRAPFIAQVSLVGVTSPAMDLAQLDVTAAPDLLLP